MKIDVSWGSKSFSLELSKTATIAELKKSAKKETNLPPKLQRFFFRGKELESGTLHENGIGTGTKLLFQTKKVVEKADAGTQESEDVEVKTSQAESEEEPQSTRTEESEPQPEAPPKSICVSVSHGKDISVIHVNDDMKTEDFVRAVATASNSIIKQLVFNGQPLKKGTTLRQCGVTDKSLISEAKSLYINVMHPKGPFKVQLDSLHADVKVLRALVAANKGISVDEVKLLVDGNTLSDGASLVESGFKEGTVVRMIPKKAPAQSKAKAADTHEEKKPATQPVKKAATPQKSQPATPLASGKAEKEKDEGCEVCKRNDDDGEDRTIIFCDGCDKQYHLECCTPKIKRAEVDLDTMKYMCPKCLGTTDAKPRKLKPSELTTKKWGGGNSCAGRKKECTIVGKKHFGRIPGVPVGTWFPTRIAASEAGVHRPPVSGMAGTAAEGCQSIAVSCGYEDDEDEGDEFIYTGAGGRDLSGNKRTALQSKDQEWEGTNLALARNCVGKQATCKDCTRKIMCKSCADRWREGKPVRVLRGAPKKKNQEAPYAPKAGYRYDGIYKVTDFWKEEGKSGFKVCRYRLKRDDDEPAPWSKEGKKKAEKLYEDANDALNGDTKETPKKRKGDDSGEEPKKKKKKKNVVLDSDEETEKTEKTDKMEVDLEDVVPEKWLKLIADDLKTKKRWNDVLSDVKCGLIRNEGTFLEKVQEKFRCCVCLEMSKLPVTSSCGHTACQACWQQAMAHTDNKCPECRGFIPPEEAAAVEINKPLLNIFQAIFPTLE